jgi:hypothetical protein
MDQAERMADLSTQADRAGAHGIQGPFEGDSKSHSRSALKPAVLGRSGRPKRLSIACGWTETQGARLTSGLLCPRGSTPRDGRTRPGQTGSKRVSRLGAGGIASGTIPTRTLRGADGRRSLLIRARSTTAAADSGRARRLQTRKAAFISPASCSTYFLRAWTCSCTS